jgi:hypothetical protein
VGQRSPIGIVGAQWQKQQSAGVARKDSRSDLAAYLARRHEKLIKGQANRHIVQPQEYGGLNTLLDREKPNPEDSRVNNQCLPSYQDT